MLEVRLDNRWLGKTSSVPSPLQLLVDLDVEFPDGRLQRAKALIDTGAEVDLVRSGFVPRHLFSLDVVPMVFIMANGSSKSVLAHGLWSCVFGFLRRVLVPYWQNLS